METIFGVIPLLVALRRYRLLIGILSNDQPKDAFNSRIYGWFGFNIYRSVQAEFWSRVTCDSYHSHLIVQLGLKPIKPVEMAGSNKKMKRKKLMSKL